LISAEPITQIFIFVHVVTLLFRVSTTWIIPVLLFVVVKSILLFASVITTFFAAPGFTCTGMTIGSIPGMFIVILSSPALKFGYNAIARSPFSTTKSFDKRNAFWFFATLFFIICVFPVTHGVSNPFSLSIFATVFNLCPFSSTTLI
jgi:hypothetical protein